MLVADLTCGALISQCTTGFYYGTVESILSGGVTVWYGNTTAQDRKTIQRVVRMAEKIIACALSSSHEIFPSMCRCKASSIIQDHTICSPSPAVWSLVLLQNSNQDMQVQEQFLPTGSAPTELLITQFVDFLIHWTIGLMDCY